LEHIKARKDAAAAAAESAKANASSSTSVSAPKLRKPWSTKETNTLIKAVKNFPGGTISRWEKVAEYVNLHGHEDGQESNNRGPDECIKKSKELQDVTIAERTALQNAVPSKKKEVEIQDAPTARVSTTPVAAKGAKPAAATAAKENVKPAAPASMFVIPEGDTSWTAAQQAQLEAGLRKYPAVAFAKAPAERWEKIAEEIDGKNKKEVKQRVKVC
jgi:DnaJ homolog subfamily C member 2